MSAALMQQPQHQPFPIADVDVGEYLAKESWLSPVTAFRSLRDAFIYRSRIRQRPGFQRFGQCSQSTATAATVLDVAGDGTYVRYTIADDSEYLNLDSIVLTYTDATNGALATEIGHQAFGQYDASQSGGGTLVWGLPVYEAGTTNVIGVVQQRYVADLAGMTDVPVNAQVDVRWNDHSGFTTGDATAGSMTFREDPRLPITGMSTFIDREGDEYLVATNTRRLFLWNASTFAFEDQNGSDQFTGGASDLFWMWPAENDLILTNNVDAVQKFTASTGTMAALGTTIGAGPDTVQTAALAVVFKNRLILIGTVEGAGANRFPRRGRWSRAGAFETYDTADFSDAATDLGDAITAQKVADRLFVGFERGWMELVFTGDEQALFEWEETTFVYGASARLGSVPDGGRILSRTTTGMQAIDPNTQYAVDDAIPDYILENMDASQRGFTIAERSIPLRQFLFSMVNKRASDSSPNEILVGTYHEDQRLRWSHYDVDATAFSTFQGGSGSNWDDIDIDWDDYDVLWDGAGGSGDPILLIGDSRGQFAQTQGARDLRHDTPFADPVISSPQGGYQDIPFAIDTQRLSPFPGRRAHLGWIDFYVEAAEGVTLTVEVRANTQLTAYFTATIELSSNMTGEKIFRRVRVGKSATFHYITVRAEGSRDFVIDAIVPWFRPAGRMRNFG